MSTTDKSNFQEVKLIKIHRLILATKVHKGARRKKDNKNHLNKKFLGVQNPFFKKGFGRRGHKLMVNQD